jgi:hypothetical protein
MFFRSVIFTQNACTLKEQNIEFQNKIIYVVTSEKFVFFLNKKKFTSHLENTPKM